MGDAAAWRGTLPSLVNPSDLPVRISHSHLWWEGVRCLLSVLTRAKIRKRLLRLDLPHQIKETLAGLLESRSIDFDKQQVGARHQLLNLVQEVTHEWPGTFVRLMSEASITAADFASCEIHIPFWLDQVVDRSLNRKRYCVSEAEVRCASALLSARGAAVSKIAVKRLLGVKEGVAIDQVLPGRRRLLTSQELLRITQQLDADIWKTATARDEQACALRDAVCIAAATCLKIPFAKASLLELREIGTLIEAWNATTSEDTDHRVMAGYFSRWATLYLTGTRRVFVGRGEEHGALFVSRFGKPTMGFGLAARYADLLRRCAIAEWQLGCKLLLPAVSPATKSASP